VETGAYRLLTVVEKAYFGVGGVSSVGKVGDDLGGGIMTESLSQLHRG